MARKQRNGGFAFTELVVTMTVLAILVAGFIVSLDGFRRFNRYQLDRQKCIAAALAQLDSLTATGAAMESAELERLWPDVEVVVGRASGTGQWSGLELVTATAKTNSFNRKVTIKLSRYMKPDVQVAREP